jgi:RNA binding exosome subunit
MHCVQLAGLSLDVIGLIAQRSIKEGKGEGHHGPKIQKSMSRLDRAKEDRASLDILLTFRQDRISAAFMDLLGGGTCRMLLDSA